MANRNIFSRLKRLFSSEVIIRNIGGHQLKVVDSGHIQTSGDIETNSLVDRFTRLHTTTTAPLYNPAMNYQTLRTQLYSDYEAMDTDSIIASTLDIISDESTLKNDQGEVLAIRSPDENIQKILYNLFYDVLNIEFNLWSWIRNMNKYGDFFLKLEIAEKFGVYNVIPYTAYYISREENWDEDNPNAIRYIFSPDGISGGGYYATGLGTSGDSENNIIFDNYEIAHFRLIADANYLPYGRAYIEPARKAFKQMVLMEDAMLVHRIVRAPEKRIFYVNVGSIPPNEIDAFMEKTISKMKRTPYIDQNTGDYNLKFNLQNMLEDFYIPIRGNDTSTKIDTTPGLQYDGITDVTYLRDKMMAALKVPKAFFGYDENVEGKATLAAEDIRFARTVERIQRIVVSELYKIALVHLYTQGYDNESLTNFELSLTVPSIIYEQEKIALMTEKVALAQSMIESKIIPIDWIYDNIYHFDESQIAEYRELVKEDTKRAFILAQIESEGNDPRESGESYGTPHDLAFLYGKGRYYTSSENDVPKRPYNKMEGDTKKGRPKEKATKRNSQEDNFGKDRMGTDRMKGKDERGLNLEMAKSTYYQNKKMLDKLPFSRKKMIFEDKEESLLDENQIRE